MKIQITPMEFEKITIVEQKDYEEAIRSVELLLNRIKAHGKDLVGMPYAEDVVLDVIHVLGLKFERE